MVALARQAQGVAKCGVPSSPSPSVPGRSRHVYDPYGNVTIYDDDWSETRETSDYDNSILYCGYYHDWETGLYHVRHRYYVPPLGRWTSRDREGYFEAMALYVYALSCPTTFVDWLGAAAENAQAQGEEAKASGSATERVEIPECQVVVTVTVKIQVLAFRGQVPADVGIDRPTEETNGEQKPVPPKKVFGENEVTLGDSTKPGKITDEVEIEWTDKNGDKRKEEEEFEVRAKIESWDSQYKRIEGTATLTNAVLKMAKGGETGKLPTLKYSFKAGDAAAKEQCCAGTWHKKMSIEVHGEYWAVKWHKMKGKYADFTCDAKVEVKGFK